MNNNNNAVLVIRINRFALFTRVSLFLFFSALRNNQARVWHVERQRLDVEYAKLQKLQEQLINCLSVITEDEIR